MPPLTAVRILIVDDEAAQMKALCNTLRDHGYETVGFASGKAALAALQTARFDLLLSDLMMPEMDGISLLRAAQTADPDLIGIIMTGEGTIATAVEAMKAGAFDYILKPFKLSVILPVISRALTVRRLRQENAELEKRVHERTTELEAVNKELEAFSYSVSHDLRAPLRAINGFTRILMDSYQPQLPADAQRLLDHVTSSAHHMGELIDHLLEFSRLGRQPLRKQPVNISNLVREVLEDLNAERANRKLEVTVGELPDTFGDTMLLRQVFTNLLSNAFKYTRQKESAEVSVGTLDQAGETVYFVKDNGAGFDLKYADKLFGVFQRMHSAKQFEGTGVGLSIVHRIIQRHGGRIWAEAAVEQGATFYFTLPNLKTE